MPIEYNEKVPLQRPLTTPDNQGFWDAVRKHQLVIQKCARCNLLFHPPRAMCPECVSADSLTWAPASGKGKVYSFVNFIYDRSAYPGIKVPYVVALVELEEGVKIISNLIDCTAQEVSIGMPVELTFVDVYHDLTLYMFKKSQ